MHTRARFAMAALFALFVGTAWAVDLNVVDITGSEGNPTDIGGDVVYDTGKYYWTNTNSADDAGYGTVENLAVIKDATLTIGASGSALAEGDIVVNFAEGDGFGSIVIGEGVGSSGMITIGDMYSSATSVSVYATDLTIINGAVWISSNSDLVKSGGANLLSVVTLDLDNSAANVSVAMQGGGSQAAAARLEVSGVAFIGAADPTDYTAKLALSGTAWFGEGIVLGYNGSLITSVSESVAITVGSSDGDVYAAGDIFMTGNAALDTTTGGSIILVILDKSAEESASGAPLSSLIIQGEDNIIKGNVDASSLKEMLVDGKVYLSSDSQLTVRDFRQVSGWFSSSGLLVVDGTTAEVTGGVFESDVMFTNAELESFVFEGTGFKWWSVAEPDQDAILAGDYSLTGVAGAGQTVVIGKYAGMDLWGSEFVDLNVVVGQEGYLRVDMDPGDVVVISSTLASAPVEFVVESANSFWLNYNNIYHNALAGRYDDVDVDPLLLVVAGDNAAVDIPDFWFDGMFGYYELASTADAKGYGLVGYEDNGIVFDGSRADADNAYAILVPTYGDAVNRGLSDLAYRAAMYEVDTPYDPAADLPTLKFLSYDVDSPEYDSAMVNGFNLLDIAAGRADASTVSLYNGSNVFGVNQVSVSTAQSHAQIGMRRSDEIRRLHALVGNSLSGSDAYASDIMNQCYTNRFWVGGFGLLEDADAYRGFDGYQYKSAGFAVGYDRMFGPNIIVGGSFAAAFGEYEDKSALSHDSDIDSYSFNLYATYTHHSGFFGSLFGGYTYSDNDIRELRLNNLVNREWNTADYHTKTWLAGGKLGYDLKPNECFTITPSVGLTWIGAKSSSHTEYLGGVAVTNVSRMKTNQTYLPVELGLGYDFLVGGGKLNLGLNLGYAYNFDNDQIAGDIWQLGYADPTPYAAVSREPGHHTYTVGGGLRYAVGRFDIGAKYDYARKSKMDSHRLYGTVGVSF